MSAGTFRCIGRERYRSNFAFRAFRCFFCSCSGSGVDTASLGDMVALQQWSVQGLDGFRSRRQGAVDGLRQRLGFGTDVGNGTHHSCNE